MISHRPFEIDVTIFGYAVVASFLKELRLPRSGETLSLSLSLSHTHTHIP
jgi:hypothetical protein